MLSHCDLRVGATRDTTQKGQVPAGWLGLVLCALVLAGLVPAGVDAASEPTGTQSDGELALAAVAGPFAALETFRAEFVQTREWLGMDEEATFTGTLYLRRPNKFRIEYSEPVGHLQVSDGTQVWTFVPENEQVLLTRIDPEEQGGDILRRILEESAAHPTVEIVEFEGETLQGLTLTPPSGLELNQVGLWVRPETKEIVRYEMQETSGNRVTYRLTKTDENPKLDPSLFHFEAPPGIPIVEVGAP